MNIQSLMKRLCGLLLALPLTVAAATFDPVNDDTDIFLVNPNLTANQPNVLIVLDNTANWNQPFSNEKNALVQVVSGLTDKFNVGLMMFPETGGANDNIDGGYVRYHIRTMGQQNRDALALLVNNLDQLGDKGNNATPGLALYESYLYFAGKASRAGHGKVKTDKDGTPDPLLAPLPGHALPAGTVPAQYRSPIADECQRSFIIYISNGPASENAAARAQLEGYLAALTGKSPPATIAINPSGQQSNWADEMAKFMANADVNTTLPGVQNIFTYVIEVDPAATGQGPNMTALMKSVAANGKGKYFGVSSSTSGAAIADALNAIFNEVQSINSVFASTTLPVSVNVRGTNLNQVYIGVFRPDPNKSPRWLGNLKMYNLALDTTTNKVYLADASNGPPPAVGNPAENTTTGFITGNATSFWSTNSTFWGFRDPTQNGVGGASDAPDGDLVEKGGAAQRIRELFPLAEASTVKRRLYTCTNAGSFTSQCTSGSALSDTPFATNNTDITAGMLGTTTAERDALINWVRGEDNFEDENVNTSNTDIRASVHGDVLHSRPAVINYNRYGSDNDVYIFYGANDGVFHAVKGGYATDAADFSGLQPGQEAWGFVPRSVFSQLKRMRENSPAIGSTAKRPYFMDGPIGVYSRDVNGNGKLGDPGDKVNLYIAMRRGGRRLYALDVNDPANPRYLWRISNSSSGFSELGQTWSNPTVVSGLAGLPFPVLIFGAGYDPAVEDIPPADIISASATSITTASGTVNRTMGRGLFVVNALTGALVWSAGAPGSGATVENGAMTCAIPADVTVIKNESGGPTNRAYVGDTCGNVWRFDFSGSNLSTSTVTRLATVGDLTTATGRRKFLHAPDVVGQQGYDAVLIGSGDREHPFDTSIVNRMYMLKDTGGDTGPLTGTGGANPTLTEAMLTDVTNNCIQDIAGCPAGVTPAIAASQLASSNGWYLTLGAGEKVVGNVVSLAGTTYFNTNQPSASASIGTCGGNLGVARQYQVNTVDATATADLNYINGLTTADRSLIQPGGGYLPSPVHVVVTLNGKPVEAVISGIQVSQPTASTLSARLRRYWYREID